MALALYPCGQSACRVRTAVHGIWARLLDLSSDQVSGMMARPRLRVLAQREALHAHCWRQGGARSLGRGPMAAQGAGTAQVAWRSSLSKRGPRGRSPAVP